ncbi:hypothetical protein [Microcystis aeruginosa]|nr:hypothetical protein [Microcystis aeruginosa]MDB9414476.1 hypothetical protein [Microcystis aeruginosa CS-567/02]
MSIKMVIPMNENEDFQHLKEIIADLRAKQKLIYVHIPKVLRIMCDCPTS